MSRRFNVLILFSLIWPLATARSEPVVPKVVATASMIGDMAKQIGGNAIAVSNVVPIGGDPHIYDPTPSDAQMVAQADLILKNGLTFEGWLNELIENSGTNAEIVTVTEGITPITSLVYKNATDPHAWMDVNRALTYIKNILDALVRLHPTSEALFQENYEKYHQKLVELDLYIQEQIKSIPEEKRILITSHDAFQYYGRRYGIRLESVIGTSTDAEVQTADIIRLNKIIKESGVPALFVESTINPKILEQLASDNKVSIGGKLYSDSIGDEDSPASTYYDMLKYNTDIIVAALKAPVTYDSREPPVKSNMALYLFLGVGLLCLLLYLIYKFNR